MHVQGFSGRAATTTLHDATETGVSISGIFQAAEDFAVLCLYNAYDYFNHLRLKPLPRTDLSDLTLEFDIEYDHALDGAMRLDAAKYPSVSWDAMTFVTGAGDIHEVRLLDHATAISGGETPASCAFEATGIAPYYGIDSLHLYFRDTRYTVAHTDCIVETQLTAAVTASASAQNIPVAATQGIEAGDYVYIERTGANEELVRVLAVGMGTIQCVVTINHPAGSFVTLQVGAKHALGKMAAIINQAGATVAGRFGPDQSAVIQAAATAISPTSATLQLQFVTPALPAARYGKLGNLDRVLVTSGHVDASPPDPPGTQQLDWTGGSGTSRRFTGGDNDTRYRITLDFTQPLLDKAGDAVPMNDCRKIYMVFAPRFEATEQELEDGCFLTAGVNASDIVWNVDDTSKLTGGRYFIGSPTTEERVRLVSVDSPTQITVERGYQGSAAASWPAGTRMKKVSPVSGFSSDVEWGCTISNIAVTGDATLKVGGGAQRIEESDARSKYTGFWESYKYGAGWPSQWWSMGHAKRTTTGQVTIRYNYANAHDLYLGTFLSTDAGQIAVSVDGDTATVHNLYLNEYGGTTANLRVRSGVSAGTHTVSIAASGGYFYYDYLWPIPSEGDAQDAPDPPQEYGDVSLAIDFDTDHGYKKPPAWHLWQLQKLGFQGHADVYMGVFWNNKRRRVDATYPYAAVGFSGAPAPGDVVSISIGGTTIAHAIGYGESLQPIVSHMRATINGMFAGVWADDNFGSSTTLRIQSKAPGYTFTGVAVSAPNSVTLTLDDHLGTPGAEGDWELVDSVSPVMTEGARRWIRDLAGQFAAAGIKASFAFSMEVYRPPSAMAARYWDGAPVDLPVPSTQMHFGSRVRAYLKQMYKECADEIAAAGLPVILQFGETQWWYFPNASGMPYYDDETKAAFEALYGRPMHRFLANTDDPNDDIETADFLRDRIWTYCQEVIAYVRQSHPSAVFECLWPLDANQGKPAPSTAFRRLNMHVNLPNEWKNSSHGVKYFRSEGFDYDVWQKNANLMRQTIAFPSSLGRPPEECIYLSGIYGPPDPPMAQAYGQWRPRNLYSFCFWAFDQFCLNSQPVPLAVGGQAVVQGARYHKPRAAAIAFRRGRGPCRCGRERRVESLPDESAKTQCLSIPAQSTTHRVSTRPPMRSPRSRSKPRRRLPSARAIRRSACSPPPAVLPRPTGFCRSTTS
jgi:hypothetical protein